MSDLVNLLTRLTTLPEELKSEIISYLPLCNIQLFMDLKPLIPCVSRIFEKKIRILPHYHAPNEPLRLCRGSCYTSAPTFESIKAVGEFIDKYNIQPRELEWGKFGDIEIQDIQDDHIFGDSDSSDSNEVQFSDDSNSDIDQQPPVIGQTYVPEEYDRYRSGGAISIGGVSFEVYSDVEDWSSSDFEMDESESSESEMDEYDISDIESDYSGSSDSESSDSDQESIVKRFDSYEDDIRIYTVLLNKFQVIHLTDVFETPMVDEFLRVMRSKYRFNANIGTFKLMLDLGQPKYELQILKKLPTTLLHLQTNGARGFKKIIPRFQHLKSLSLFYSRISEFQFFPQALEILDVGDVKIDTRLPVIQGFPRNLKEFEFQIDNSVNLISDMISRMRELETLTVECPKISNVGALKLPHSIKNLVFTGCCKLIGYKDLRKLQNLRSLKIEDGPFSKDLVFLKDCAPFLTTFSFSDEDVYVNTRKRCRIEYIKLPENIKSLSFLCRADVETWTPPSQLRELHLMGTHFSSKSFDITLSTNFYALSLCATNLKNIEINNLPVGLRHLVIRNNRHLQMIEDSNFDGFPELIKKDIKNNGKRQRLREDDQSVLDFEI
ncbi:hypothetical protein G210_3267 [Candida maltosa Xu316]|uniref:Uncharacterized protein n=1 Tax=Candida maltosa (strain Xu316) TaxID=1245528 RepID=M3IJD0_CANMX|nr:hypothetical protein G210_3267 [Candida maltosa Xu316]